MLTSYEKLWNNVLKDIQSQLNKQSYEMWLKDTEAINLENDTIIIKVQDEIAKDHINSSFNDLIKSILVDYTGRDVNCVYVTNDEADSVSEEPVVEENITTASEMSLENDETELMFNPNYTFENFVIGPNNQLAHAASFSASKSPATQYNPLFLYGDSGLGKTHLLQAVGHAIMKEKPYLKILYVTSENFVNEFIQSIRNNTVQQLKIKYRNVDVLLIDDIQFIAKMEKTQEEFFHTFEDLYRNKKQIVITSDRSPKELEHLTDRLRTRFEWGLLADIQPPNLETREAILRNKAERENIYIPDEVLTFIARRIKSSIRALESALKKLHVVATVQKQPITIDLAKVHLRPLFEERHNKQITINDIMKKVASRYNVTVENMKSKSRHSSIVQPRFIAMYLSTQLTNLTTTEIGREFGNRDHSTVINARNNIGANLETDESLKEIIDDIVADLKS